MSILNEHSLILGFCMQKFAKFRFLHKKGERVRLTHQRTTPSEREQDRPTPTAHTHTRARHRHRHTSRTRPRQTDKQTNERAKTGGGTRPRSLTSPSSRPSFSVLSPAPAREPCVCGVWRAPRDTGPATTVHCIEQTHLPNSSSQSPRLTLMLSLTHQGPSHTQTTCADTERTYCTSDDKVTDTVSLTHLSDTHHVT
jgi:hypothetical protein